MAWLDKPPDQPVLRILEAVHGEIVAADPDVEVVFWFDDLDRFKVLNLYKKRRAVLGSGAKSKICLVLNSPGGDIDAAFILVEILRTHYKGLEVLLPFWCKSAATLVCLAADRVKATSIAEMGPLDPQVLEAGESRMKSVLDEYQALTQVRKEAMQCLEHSVAFIEDKAKGLTFSDIVNPAKDFAAALLRPLYSQIDPAVLGKRARQLDIGYQYAVQLMTRYRLTNDLQRTDEQIRVMAWKLVYGYPSHSFVINYNEARALGVPVRLINSDPCDRLVELLISLISKDEELHLVGGMADQVADSKKGAEKNEQAHNAAECRLGVKLAEDMESESAPRANPGI